MRSGDGRLAVLGYPFGASFRFAGSRAGNKDSFQAWSVADGTGSVIGFACSQPCRDRSQPFERTPVLPGRRSRHGFSYPAESAGNRTVPRWRKFGILRDTVRPLRRGRGSASRCSVRFRSRPSPPGRNGRPVRRKDGSPSGFRAFPCRRA